MTPSHNVLALDVGERRVGVALANTLARLPRPYTTLTRDEQFWDELQKLINTEAVQEIVVGLPRSLDGNETAQTIVTRKFITELEERFGLSVQTQDEALTSHQAKKELAGRGKNFGKADIDALAATYILEDYLKAGEH
jgi:putative pre-16S rRNA nuclease